MTINDPASVAREYASERGLEGRRAAYRYAEGPSAPELAFEAIAEARPARVLEVGCGPGELAARVAAEVGADVVAVDSSPRMVQLARDRGVDARVGDVQQLAFADGDFDCAIAAWMLYHVADVGRALGELARVLRPGGRLVAVTNSNDHLRELRELVGAWPRPRWRFSGDDGAELLARHFGSVEVRDAGGVIRFPSRGTVIDYIESAAGLFGHPAHVPEFDLPLVVRRHPVIFVAEK